MRSLHVNFPRLRCRTTPGSSDPGASRSVASACRVSIASSTGAHVSSARSPGRIRVLADPAAGVITATVWSAATTSPGLSG